MPRNVAQSTSSCATSTSTERSMTPVGGRSSDVAAKIIAATKL